jgi:phage terminase small subunit
MTNAQKGRSQNHALTLKQENFCLAYIETGNASEAYRRAYSTVKVSENSLWVNANKLLKNAKVALRLQELRKPVIEAAQITLADHLSALERLRDLAEKEGKYSAAVSAEMARGKASGLYVDKVEATVTTKELPVSVDEFV